MPAFAKRSNTMSRIGTGTALCRVLGAGLALSAASVALADLPAALDRVPADAAMAAGVNNLAAFRAELNKLEAMLPGADFELGGFDDMMGAQGLNTEGSFAFAVVPGPEDDLTHLDLEDGDAPAVLIVPVSDYAAFVRGFGGDPAAGIASAKAEGKALFIKDIGGGYAAMSPRIDVLEGFAGEPGQTGAHEAAIGTVGGRVASNSDAVVIANVQRLRPAIEEGVKKARAQADQMMQMAGPDGAALEGQLKILEIVGNGFARDGKAALFGIDLDESGVSIDLAANFAEGSEIAGFFQSAGHATKLMDKLPKVPFLFAFAADTSAPGMKKIMSNLAELSKGIEGVPQGFDFSALLAQGQGGAMVWGTTPALMGGIFTNATVFIPAEDPAAMRETTAEWYGAMNGQGMQGITFQSEYTKNTTTLEGVEVDQYRVRFAPDGQNPQGMQMQQAMMMMYGPAGGPSGYSAAAGGGIVQTLSPNQGMMIMALKAAKGEGAGLGSDNGIKAVNASLPEDPSFVYYVGVGGIMETVGSVMMMMGGGVQLDVPANLPPVGIGGTTDAGGFRAKAFVPAQVIETIAKTAEAMNPNAGMDMEEDDGGPRF